ncbi:BolA-like protein [Encephalitozoon hellem]|uniref:BolA-like protein n=1 Tax=Encephalitozoon hellem TaxID=27973 RepID=A0A9Q9CEA4_ENCHE|nr:BolA-like protein [Encephalitozoon hellem]
MKGGLESRMFDALKKEFCPASMEVRNTSYDHIGHREVGMGGLETHFRVKIKSAMFNGMVSLSNRHRLVHKTLEFAFQEGLHAIEIDCDSDSQE